MLLVAAEPNPIPPIGKSETFPFGEVCYHNHNISAKTITKQRCAMKRERNLSEVTKSSV
jgi:hypothetical protein